MKYNRHAAYGAAMKAVIERQRAEMGLAWIPETAGLPSPGVKMTNLELYSASRIVLLVIRLFRSLI